MKELFENGKKNTFVALCLLLVLTISIVFLLEDGRPSEPADYIKAIVNGLFVFFFVVMLLLGLLTALAKGLDLDLSLKYLPWVFTGILALYVVALLDAKREPWSLWEIHEYDAVRFKKIARYVNYNACKDEARRRLDKQMKSNRAVVERLKEKDVRVSYILAGSTIFKFIQPLGKFTEQYKSRYVAKLENRKDLTENEKQRMADEVYGPEIQSTLSLVCLPTIREKYWPPPFDTPKDYFVASATLADIGKAALAREHFSR